MSSASPQNVLIVGASRGLGLGMAREFLGRGWVVTGTVRQAAGTPLHDLTERYGHWLTIETVDINEPDQVAALRRRLAGQRFDLLFVNAGVSNGRGETVRDVSTESFTRLMVTNALSPMRVLETLEPLVTEAGTIGVMSSGLGSVANNVKGEWEVYRASKAALNTLMRSFAVRHAKGRRSLLIIAPGWVKTDMGGPEAVLDVETSMRGVVDTLLRHAGTPGLRYVDYQGQTVPW